MRRAWGVVVAVLGGCSFVEHTSPRWPKTHDDKVECYTSNTLPTIDLTLGLLATAGPYLALRDYQPGSHGAIGLGLIAGTFMLGGVTAIIAGVYGYAAASNCRSAKREHNRLQVAHEVTVDSERRAKAATAGAWETTKRAAAAARKDGCLSVRALDARVRALDADFHARVFLRDVAIARCLTAASASP